MPKYLYESRLHGRDHRPRIGLAIRWWEHWFMKTRNPKVHKTHERSLTSRGRWLAVGYSLQRHEALQPRNGYEVTRACCQNAMDEASQAYLDHDQ